jgi:hypothetical protein
MGTGRLRPEPTVSWPRSVAVPVDQNKEELAFNKFIKALAILVFGLLLQILVDFSENADTRRSEYSNAERGLTANLAAGEATEMEAVARNTELVTPAMQTGTSIIRINAEEDHTITSRQPIAEGMAGVGGRRVKVTATLREPAAGDNENAAIEVIRFTEIK